MDQNRNTIESGAVDPAAMFKLSYGLFVLTAKEGDKDNGCIINTVTQITAEPNRISIAVNKANYTCDMIARTGVFNVSVLTEAAPFRVFEHFGFSSGRDRDKFASCEEEHRTQNGLLYIPRFTNGILSAQVVQANDWGSHMLFIGEVTQSMVLSGEPSVTYQYYFDHVKPRPQPSQAGEKTYTCKICGYVYEGYPLPPDFICPICKHGAEAFEGSIR